MFPEISNLKNNIGLNKTTSFKPSSITAKFNKLSKNEAYYAKKGEPIYQKDMDLDEDGVVSMDEFREYCKNNDADVEQLLKNWLVYHSSKDVAETSKRIKEEKEEQKLQESDETLYAKKGDIKYEAVMDSNDDGKITYKEYIEYCKTNAKEEKKDTKTTTKEGSDDELTITSVGKAIGEYNKTEPPEGKIETEA